MHALLDDDDDNAMVIVNELGYPARPVEKLRIGEDKNWRASGVQQVFFFFFFFLICYNL